MSNPVAFERDPDVAPQYLIPGNFPISSLTISGTTATVTLTDAVYDTITISPNIVVGQRVRFHIPSGYGTYQLNGVDGVVTANPSTDIFTVSINWPVGKYPAFNTFVASPGVPYSYQTPQLSAIGDINNSSTGVLTSITNANLAPSGAFQNISPFLT